MVSKTIIRFLADKRLPMIKFRKGGNNGAPAQTNVSPGSSGTAHYQERSVIEDWQLPARYRRKPIDAIECEYINRGGPA